MIEARIDEYITKVFISEDKRYLVLQATDCRHLVFLCSGDCCNEVYFNHASGVENLLETRISALYLPSDVPTTNEATDFTVLKIGSDKGWCDFETRNDCSGYEYSGEINYKLNGGFPIEEMRLLIKDF